MNRTRYKRFLVLGVGGGWRTPLDLAFFLSYFMPESELVIVDGGTYQSRQLDHEHFAVPGNKARIQAEFVLREFPGLRVEAIKKYVGLAAGDQVIPVQELLQSGDVIFLQVDNNKTRNLVAEHAGKLADVTLISGGTNEDQLRVIVYIRRGHRDLTPSFSSYCDEIAQPADESPAERLLRQEGCLEQIAKAEHFHPFTMLATSTFMLNAFYAVWKLESSGRLCNFPYELWYDIAAGRCRTESWSPPI